MEEQKFETAMKQLEEIVRNLEEGTLPLEEALKAFEEGIRLLSLCGRKLDEAEKKVALLMRQGDEYVKVPFNPQNETGEDNGA